MSHRVALALILALALPLSAPACATSSAGEREGKCTDYRPMPACSMEFQSVCHTTEDGCEECSCVPRRENRDGIGPQGPYDPMR
ncbi:MAG: hypothetical protein KC635_10770 [Myxococcales bacterium]|nr:hypothetical protein [Myxococcales bacterium]MCB9737290.1 hypothetical protein [Deltaproteobacteria bacterium]